jgi:hypothetical protein
MSVQFKQFDDPVRAKVFSFYPQYFIAIFQVEVYFAGRELLQKLLDKRLRPSFPPNICLKNLDHHK